MISSETLGILISLALALIGWLRVRTNKLDVEGRERSGVVDANNQTITTLREWRDALGEIARLRTVEHEMRLTLDAQAPIIARVPELERKVAELTILVNEERNAKQIVVDANAKLAAAKLEAERERDNARAQVALLESIIANYITGKGE